MSAMTDGVLETIHLDFELACLDLAQAKLARLSKDTPAARARVAACRDRVDAILDMRNAAGTDS